MIVAYKLRALPLCRGVAGSEDHVDADSGTLLWEVVYLPFDDAERQHDHHVIFAANTETELHQAIVARPVEAVAVGDPKPLPPGAKIPTMKILVAGAVIDATSDKPVALKTEPAPPRPPSFVPLFVPQR